MRKKEALSLVASVAIAVSLPTVAIAQDEAINDGMYVRAGVGVSFVNDFNQEFVYNPDAVFAMTPPVGQTIENDTGFLAAFALGFDYTEGIRTELEYRYASSGIDSVTLDDPLNGPTASTPINDDIVSHFLMTNFYFDFYNSSPLTPFIGGGVGGAFVENESAQRDAALALQGRAGVSLAVGGGFSADLEYIYLRTNELAFGPKVDDFEPGGPAGPAVVDERYEASSIMMSLRKQF
ncbi:MAG: P44/Msp2 family outer membrane protein [Pseudomonadota bacterium]